MTTPTRVPSQLFGSRPVLSSASLAAMTTSWVERSKRWAVRRPSVSCAWKGGSEQQKSTGSPPQLVGGGSCGLSVTDTVPGGLHVEAGGREHAEAGDGDIGPAHLEPPWAADETECDQRGVPCDLSRGTSRAALGSRRRALGRGEGRGPPLRRPCGTSVRAALVSEFAVGLLPDQGADGQVLRRHRPLGAHRNAPRQPSRLVRLGQRMSDAARAQLPTTPGVEACGESTGGVLSGEPASIACPVVSSL